MSGHTALILGAGFSKPAGGPLLRELLSGEVLSVSDADEVLLIALSVLAEARKSAAAPNTFTLEELFTEVWREARTGGGFNIEGEEFPASQLLDCLLIHLASTCGDLHVRRGTNMWNLYAEFLQNTYNSAKTLTIITFNYDLVVEQFLDDLDLPFYYGRSPDLVFDADFRRRARYERRAEIPLLKLHGSSNWGVCVGCGKAERDDNVVTAFEKPLVLTRNRSCPFCRERFLKSGIVPPIIGKAGEFQHLADTWGQARRGLRRGREVVVVGYSLPPADLEAVSLLREVEGITKRPRITVACGPKGAPPSYRSVFSRFDDALCYFEDFEPDL